MNAVLQVLDDEDIHLGWIALESGRGIDRARWGIKGQSTLVTRATVLVARHLQAHQGQAISRETLKDILRAHGLNPTGVAVALGELKFALGEAKHEGKKLTARQVEKIFDTRDTDTVTWLPYSDDALVDKPAPPPEPAAPENTAPAAAAAFNTAHGPLPARLDTGDFTVEYEPGRALPARINGTEHGLRESNYAILVDLFQNRGTILSSRDLGQKYYPDHQTPTGTVAAAIFNIRGALARAQVPGAETMVTTVRGKGFVYAGPKAPALKDMK